MVSTETSGDSYICVSIHEASSDAPGFSPLYEERVTLIKAGSKEEARQKASLLVGKARHTYKNEGGDTITWTCRRVVDVVEMVDDAFVDGAEIYGRYFRDLSAYERFLESLHGLS